MVEDVKRDWDQREEMIDLLKGIHKELRTMKVRIEEMNK